MAKGVGMRGRLTLVLSRELDQAVGAVRDVARFLSRTDVADVTDGATVEAAIGESEGPLGMFFKLSDQVSTASAKHPEEAKRLRDMLRSIEELARKLGDPSLHPALQTFQSLCRALNTEETDGQDLTKTIDYYSAEFEREVSGRSPLSTKVGGSQNGNGNGHLGWTEADSQRNASIKVRAREVAEPEFVSRVVLPHVFSGQFEEAYLDCKAAIVHEIGTGRATVGYQFGGETLAFGKLYSDDFQAQHSFQVQRELWKLGFDQRDPYQVPEPITYLAPYNLEIIRAVRGRQLATLFEEQHPEFSNYAKQAARWLVKLHRLPIRVGRDETLWQSMWLYKTLRHLAKTSAAVPDRREELIRMVDRLCDLGIRSLRDSPRVQAHGTFHYEHVFVDGLTTIVIDFDRSFPSDPAKDLAEFLSFLRWKSFQQTGSVRPAEQPSRAFLEEYLRYLPENSANLPLHWGANALRTFFKQVKHHGQDDSCDAGVRFLRDEFDSILSGKLLTGLGCGEN